MTANEIVHRRKQRSGEEITRLVIEFEARGIRQRVPTDKIYRK